MNKRLIVTLTAAGLALAACDQKTAAPPAPESAASAISVTSGPAGAWTSEPAVVKNLANFDTLDFDVYTNQKWDRLKETHAENIVVTWPDGRETTSLGDHIKDLSFQFSFAPDTRIKVHPIRLAAGEWTAVQGEMEGTFSLPMKLPDGKSIPPTGKTFKLKMVTIGHWTKDGVMDHEWLIWDNDAFNKQIGLK